MFWSLAASSAIYIYAVVGGAGTVTTEVLAFAVPSSILNYLGSTLA